MANDALHSILPECAVRQQVIKAVIGDQGRDPGYWGSARMILEAGLCLAIQVLPMNIFCM
jgi:hypothetical protein